MILTCPECTTSYAIPDGAINADGRKVKCKKCAHIWFTTAADLDDPVKGSEEVKNQTQDEDTPPEAGAEGNEQEDNPFEEAVAAFKDDIELDAASSTSDDGIESDDSSWPVDSYELFHPKLSEPDDAVRALPKKFINLARSPIPAIAATIAIVVAATFFFRAQIVRVLPATSGLFSTIGYPVNLRGLEIKNVKFEQNFENGLPVLSIHGDIINITGDRVSIPKLRFALRNEHAQEVYYWSGVVDQETLESGGAIPFTTRLSSPPITARDIMIRFTDRVSG